MRSLSLQVTRWWFQIFIIFIPIFREDFQFDYFFFKWVGSTTTQTMVKVRVASLILCFWRLPRPRREQRGKKFCWRLRISWMACLYVRERRWLVTSCVANVWNACEIEPPSHVSYNAILNLCVYNMYFFFTNDFSIMFHHYRICLSTVLKS